MAGNLQSLTGRHRIDLSAIHRRTAISSYLVFPNWIARSRDSLRLNLSL